MIMLDLCAGLGGASVVMRERGWSVTTLDYDPKFNTDIVADVRDWHYRGPQLDLIWASPPCDDFAREWMPWCKTGKTPDMSIYLACRRIIDEAKPRYWVIENVIGAVKYFGPYNTHFGPFYLWGHFPDLGNIYLKYRSKETLSSSNPEGRALIPRMISTAIANAVEKQKTLFEYTEAIA